MKTLIFCFLFHCLNLHCQCIVLNHREHSDFLLNVILSSSLMLFAPCCQCSFWKLWNCLLFSMLRCKLLLSSCQCSSKSLICIATTMSMYFDLLLQCIIRVTNIIEKSKNLFLFYINFIRVSSMLYTYCQS